MPWVEPLSLGPLELGSPTGSSRSGRRSILYTGNRLPTLTAQITDSTGTAIDLTGATIQFALRGSHDTVNVFRGTGQIVGLPVDGYVRYDLIAPDLATILPGLYDGQWVITIAGKTEDVPAGQFEVRRSFG